MSKINLNHGDSPTLFSNAHNSSDSHPFRRAIRDMVGVCKLRMIVCAFLQPFVRQLLHDELVKFYAVLETTLTALRSHTRGASRSLQLKFSQEMADEVFTGEWIVAKGDGTLEVALVDGATGDLVRHGHGSSGKIEIVPVEGNFDPREKENWTSEDFNSKIVVGEDGRNSLLSKNPYLKMEQGNAPVREIKFKHAQKWLKKGKFRLGARVVHQPNAIRIREAVSEPFIVKDWGLKPKKKFPPSPTDEVWRLINIAKEGAFHKRLVKEKILTVKDFLIEFLKNPERLQRDILKMSSNARWKATSDHALTCPPLQIMPSHCRLSSPTNDLAAAPSTSFGNSELQHDNNNCGLASELLSQTSSSAHIPTQPYLSLDDIWAMCDQQNAPSNLGDAHYVENLSDWIDDLCTDDIYPFSLIDAAGPSSTPTFHQMLVSDLGNLIHEFDIDVASAGVTTNARGAAAAAAAAAIPKFSKRWAKMSSVVRWFSLKKAIASKTLHVAKKRRLC